MGQRRPSDTGRTGKCDRWLHLRQCQPTRDPDAAMPGLVPGIYVFVALTKARKAWMAGTSPAMTEGDGSARKQKIRERSQSDLGRPVLFAKIFRFVIYPNHF